jgi:two-component sensor histidine kinase
MAEGVDILRPGKAIPEELSAFATRDNELGRLSRSFVAMKVRLDESFGALETSLAEKDVLLKEVHHRVKNNLQIVSSILSIQAGTLEDEGARSSFDECQNRIQAMALVHEEVYRTGSFVELGMRGYLSRICETLGWGRAAGACRTAISVRVDESAVLSMDKAIPCGLVVNELVTNALKHAFRGRDSGSITVSFSKMDDDWNLTISDDGVGKKPSGAPGDPDPGSGADSGDGIGEQLVLGLVSQLGGSIRYELPSDGGTSVIVRFPA